MRKAIAALAAEMRAEAEAVVETAVEGTPTQQRLAIYHAAMNRRIARKLERILAESEKRKTACRMD